MVASHVADRQSSSWSVYERIRIEERFQATLAGILELDMLKVKYNAIVQAALEISDQDVKTDQETTYLWKQRQHGQCEYPQQAQDLSSLTDKMKGSLALKLAQSASQNVLGGADSTAELLTYSFQPQTEIDRVSRTSSGFYDMDSRSLLNSQSSLNISVSTGSHLDLSSIPYCHMDSGVSLGCTKTTKGRRRPFSTGDVDMLKNFLSNAELYPKSRWSTVGTILQPHFHLNPKFQLDLVSGSTGEVYRFPSPLHAIALQSPLFTAAERHSLAQSLSSEDTKRVPSLTNEHLAGEQQSWTCTFKSCSRPTPRPASGLDFDYQSNERSRPSDEYIFNLVLKYQQRNATSKNQQYSWFTSASRKSILVSSLASAGGALACGTKLQKQISTCSMSKSFHRHSKSPNFQTCPSDVSTFGSRSSLLSNSFAFESELNFTVNKVGSTADLVSPERHCAFVSNNCSSGPEMCLDFPVLGSRRTSFGDTFHKVSGKQRSRRQSQQKWMSLLEVSSLNHDKLSGERICQKCPGCSMDTKPLSGLRYGFQDGRRAFSKDSLPDKVFDEDELITDFDFYDSKPNLSGEEEEESDRSSLGISSTCSVAEPSENFKVNKEAAQRPKVFSSLRLFSFNGNSSKK